jgi:hypothetical protein
VNPLATLFTIRIIESFLQSIKDQAVGALNLAIGPQVSYRNILDLDGASLTKFMASNTKGMAFLGALHPRSYPSSTQVGLLS